MPGSTQPRFGFRGHWLAVLMIVSGFVVDPPPASAEDDVDLVALDADLADFRGRLGRVREAVDRSSFDPDALVDRLDFEADAIVRTVADDIVFQPYEGTLRGVSGTLRAGAGNSLDQSILLAAMLKSAGYDARVVSGTLAAADALTLLRQTAAATPAADLDYLQPALGAAFPKLADRKRTVDLSATQAAENARQQSTLLVKALGSAGIDLKTRDATAHWQEVLQAYFWVQHREGPAADWQDAHPAFGSAAPSSDVGAQEYFEDRVPPEYHHTFTLQAFIESYEAGEIIRHALMSPWTVPVANHAGLAIRYSNAPSGLGPASGEDLAEAVAGARFFTPVLNGGSAPGAQAFDLQGRVVDPFALGSPAAELFQTLGDKLADATDAVQDDGDGQPLLALHSAWLEFTHTAPSGRTRTQRRYLIPPRAEYDQDAQTLAWPLITDHVYVLAAGGEPLDLLADRYLHTAVQDVDWLKVMVHKMFDPETRQPVPAALPAEFPPLVQYWLMDHDPAPTGAGQDVIAYRAEPGLLGLRRGHRDAETAFLAVDVVWNAVEHVRATAQGLEQLPRAAVSRGVWDTALESVPARVQQLRPDNAESTVHVMQLAAEQGLQIKVLAPSGDADLSGLGLGAAAQAFLNDDLQSGYAVVLPTSIPNGAASGAWWRVDPQTGETLGMTADGYGAELVEYVVDMSLTFRSLAIALDGLEECRNQPTMDTKLCCLVEANVNNVAGLSFGGILSATTGTAGSAVFELMNSDEDNPIMPSADAGCGNLPASEF